MIPIPNSIREINALPESEKRQIYGSLLPDWLASRYNIDRDAGTYDGIEVARFRCPTGSRAVEIDVKRRAQDIDPMLYLNMTDTFNNQLLVLLVVINDPESERFNVDVDTEGNRTHFGTVSRNLPAELEAMRAGLAPGQVRRGLREFKQLVPLFETFVGKMAHDLFLIEPLSYHNAIIFERYGFAYVRGLQEMRSIDQGFRPDGYLYAKLNENNPFRHPQCALTVRGRSWAIHDGILGHPFTGFQMYKRLGHTAGINTISEATW